jgi:glycosyltransferase involved in cell wall biosynthesis
LHRPSISLCCIAKNEQNNLVQWHNSIKDLMDEIIFVDTGSTDGTVQVAESLGIKVHHFQWVNDFSAARNFAFSLATKDYILWMDLDDILEGKEDFIKWRDEILHLCDYWLANYIYSSHADGTPACTFVRERVVKRSLNIPWKYFVHEGLVPNVPGLKMNFIPSWRIRHMRTEEDLKKDRSRNLLLFDKNSDKIDSRMMYYWGKELFESGKHLEAVRKLEDAITQTDLEIHDRTLAMQYLCMSYVSLNQFEKAINMGLTALALAPLRAEFYTIIGDSFLKLNQLMNSVPFFEAATQCPLPQGNMNVSPVFFHQDAYTSYPKNQLARIFANLSQVERAKVIALEAYESHKHPESKQILDELNRISTLLEGPKTAKECPDIVFTGTPNSPYVWDGEEYRNKGMGGSETACIEMAEWLAKLSGRKVKVFNARPDQKIVNGVEYLPVGQVNQYMASHKPYLHIAWRHNVKLTDAPTFAWCHDLITQGIEQTANYVKALCLTPFHADFMHNMQLVPYDKIFITRNGIRPDRFRDSVPVKKNPNMVLFPSSPDRGLDRAMLVMDQVRKDYPDLELHVFYGIEHLPQWGHAALHDKLKLMFAERPWVKYHGKTEQSVLTSYFKQAIIWLHPCDFIETSCITAMEMIASGVYPVTRRLGGLKDTLAWAEKNGMATLLEHDCVTPEEFKNYALALKNAIDERRWERSGFKSFSPELISWEKVAISWLEELPRLARIEDPFTRTEKHLA